jgi:hypothetical protein
MNCTKNRIAQWRENNHNLYGQNLLFLNRQEDTRISH